MADVKKTDYSNENVEILKDVFLGSARGQEAFKILLVNMGYFGVSNTDESRAVKNYATRLVRALSPDDTDMIASAVVNALSVNRKITKESK